MSYKLIASFVFMCFPAGGSNIGHVYYRSSDEAVFNLDPMPMGIQDCVVNIAQPS